MENSFVVSAAVRTAHGRQTGMSVLRKQAGMPVLLDHHDYLAFAAAIKLA
jgi:hypothetical protein